MAKNTNLTMAGLRLAEEEMKTAKTQHEQKPLTAITVALAEMESKNQTPGITMAGLRQAEQRMAPNMTMGGLRLAEKNDAGLQAARQAFTKIQNERNTPATIAGFRQTEQRMAPNMTMGGLRRAEKNEAGLQAAQQALARMQESGAKRTIRDLPTIAVPHPKGSLMPFQNAVGTFPERDSSIIMLNEAQQLSFAGNNESDKLQNGGNFDANRLTLNKTISNYEKEVANENLTPDLEAELKQYLAMARNVSRNNPELAYAILEYVATKGQSGKYDLDILRQKQYTLQAWSTSLREQFLRVASKNTENSQKAIKTIIEQQAVVGSELQKVETQIQYMKKRGMKESEIKYPFYNTLTKTKEEKNNILNNLAENVADYYQEIWYNIDENKAKQLSMNIYAALTTISSINHEINANLPTNTTVTAAKDVLDTLKDDQTAFKDGYIIDQAKLKGVEYGSLGNSPGNGCGWIAAYNALKALGEKSDPYDIMREVGEGALLAGTVGTDPLYLLQFFRNRGYDAEVYVTKEGVEREVLRSDASILVYGYAYNGGIGAHFIAGYPMQNGSADMRFFNDGYKKENYIGPIDAHYHDYDIFRFAICINKP